MPRMNNTEVSFKDQKRNSHITDENLPWTFNPYAKACFSERKKAVGEAKREDNFKLSLSESSKDGHKDSTSWLIYGHEKDNEQTIKNNLEITLILYWPKNFTSEKAHTQYLQFQLDTEL